MIEITPGHQYELDHLDGHNTQILNFVNRNPGQECEGTTNQEVIRALIARIKFLDNQVRWDLNDQIIHHLRMALALHEARAIIRKTEKDEIEIEKCETSRRDGHLIISEVEIF